MRRVVVAASFASLAIPLAAPPQAGAAGIHEFRIRDLGDRIAFHVAVCTTPGRVIYIRLRLEEEGGSAIAQPVFRSRQRYRCTSYRYSTPDNFPNGVYCARLKIRIPSIGYSRFTRWRCLFIE